MNIKGKENTIMFLIALLWIGCFILALTDHYLLAMEFSILLMGLHLILGVAKDGIVSKSLLMFPIIPWAIVWAVGFYLAYSNAIKFDGIIPTTTFGGFHPSFGPVVYLYWIGGMLTLAIGFYFKKDEWLSESEWENFKSKVEKIQGKGE